MPPPTPGSGRRRNEKHVPFNNQPKNVGTRTGKPMPKHVSRTSDGFEDPSEFFRSPADANFSRLTGLTTPGNLSSFSALSMVTPSTAPRRGRMSQLAKGSDDDDDAEDGLLVDEDDIVASFTNQDDDDQAGAGDTGTPRPFYSSSTPRNVPIPDRSALPPASPATHFDDIPSPAKSTPRRADRSPKKSLARRTNTPPPAGGMSFEDGPDEDIPVTDSAQRRKSVRRRTEITSDDDEAAGVEMGRTRNSMASRRSGVDVTADTEDEQSNIGGQSFRFDPGTPGTNAAIPMDFDEDLGGGTGFDVNMDTSMGDFGDAGDGDADAVATTYDSRTAPDAASHHSSGTGAITDESIDPMLRDVVDDGDEDEEDDDPERTPRAAKSKGAARKRVTVREPAHRAPSQPRDKFVPRSKKARVSGIADADGEYEGDFRCRRSGRTHMAPLAFWRGEKVVYGRGHGLAEVKEVVRIEREPVQPLGARRTNVKHEAGRGRSVSSKPNGANEDKYKSFELETKAVGVVKAFGAEDEITRRVAYPKSMLDPKTVARSGFKYQKVFGEDQFIAAGVVHIPIGGSKPSKFSRDNSYVFYVIQGCVQVTIHKTSFVIATGGQFMIPRGNYYEIVCVSEDEEAHLFFAQARKIRLSEDDEEMVEKMAHEAVRQGSAARVGAEE